MTEAPAPSGSSLYEPSDHRVIRRPTTYFETYLHLVKASIGTGILAMPIAFSKAGYVVGIVGTTIIGILCTYCLRILVSVQYELCRRNEKPMMSYTKTAKYSIRAGPECCRGFQYMSLIANLFVLGFQIGAACIYMIFLSKNVEQVLAYYWKFFAFDVRLWCIIMLTPLLVSLLIDNLKFLAILSFTANVATLMGFAIIWYYIFEDINGLPKLLKDIKPFGNYIDYPEFIGTVVFSMEAIGVILPLENEMKNPRQFTSLFGVLNCAMIPTVILYILVGLLGYIKYGEKQEGSITLMLPKGEYLSQGCKLLLSYAIFCTQTLAIFVAYDIVWKAYIQKKYELEEGLWKTWLYQYICRVLLAILVLILSVVIPNLQLFIALCGSLTLASAGIAFPALFNLYAYWNDYSGIKFKLMLIWFIFIMIVGAVILILGVTTSVYDIYVTIYAKKNTTSS